MAVELMTDRQLLIALSDAGDELMEEERAAFSRMRARLESDDGTAMSGPQRVWAEEVFNRLHLKSPSRRRPGKAALGTVRPEPAPAARWWDGSDPKFHPLKPPPGNKPWVR